jgi:hypothetical protein
MRKAVFALLFSLIHLASLHAATISGSITYTFTTTVPCSSTVTTNCASNFVVGYMAGTAFVPVSSVALPAVPSGTMTVPVPGFQFNGIYGQNIQFGVSIAVKDVNGNAWTPPPFVPPTGASLPVGPVQATGLVLTAAP